MKKITFLIACVFGILNINAQNSCGLASEVSAGLHTVDAINGAQATPACTGNGEASMAEWYSYTPTEDRYVTVSTDLIQNAGGDTRIQVYDGDCTSLDCVTGDDDDGVVEPEGGGNSYLSIASFSATGGTTYYIAFDNNWSAAGFDFEITEEEPLPPTYFNFSAQTVAGNGWSMALVDMNGDYLDDIVSIGSDNVHLQLQTSSGFNEMNIPTDNADWTPDWSIAVGDYNADGYNDLFYTSLIL